MMLVTGASGALGGLILDRLGAVADLGVVAGTRAATGAARRIDFDDPTTLVGGFTGVRVLVFVSAGYAEDDVVLARHGAVVDAAATAGVRHVIYTSLAGSGDQLSIALAHRWTEARLAEAPFDVTVLRNGLYAEIPAGLAMSSAESAATTGVFTAPLGHGRVSVVAREDLADVAARVAVETQADLAAGQRSRHAGRTYELAGATAIGGEDIAGVLAEVLGRPVTYQPVSLAQAREALAGGGLEPYQVSHTLSMFANTGAGLLESPGDDLAALLPTPPRPALELICDALKAVVPLPAA
ncbi:NmrA family NAD(P)-binding protein [Saccharothrix deserti]|uniref:NmrA family NAD(P)-binding protein n=1 Tax=Saccharothrix deserti TaxID=2593674 RepID=UPI00131BCF06|nr:NmrA family NAD(P)-binding protein [Saccharothrix deserti]